MVLGIIGIDGSQESRRGTRNYVVVRYSAPGTDTRTEYDNITTLTTEYGYLSSTCTFNYLL